MRLWTSSISLMLEYVAKSGMGQENPQAAAGILDHMEEQALSYVILHEMHHLQTMKLVDSYHSFTEKFSALERYIFRFTGEGMAIKFCNNAEGAISKRMNPGLDANIGIPAMAILNRHFPEHLALFQDTGRKIESGLVSEKEIDEQFRP